MLIRVFKKTMSPARATDEHLRRIALLGAVLTFATVAVLAQVPGNALVLGQSLPIGDSSDIRGMSVQAGTSAYIEYINTHGGVNGRPVRLVTLEDGGDPVRHAQNVRQLVTEHRAIGILNCVGKQACQASAQIAAEMRIPLLGPITSTKDLGSTANPWVFPVRPTIEREANVLAIQLTAVGVSNVAILTRNPKASEVLPTVREQLGKQGIKSEIIVLNALNLGALNSVLKSLEQGRFQAVWMDLDYESVSWIAESGNDKREEWPRMLASTSTNALVVLKAGFKDRVIAFTSPVPDPEVISLPLASDFQTQAEISGGAHAINDSGFEAYINIRLGIEALKRAGTKPDAVNFAVALRKMINFDLRGFPVDFRIERSSASERVFVSMRARNGSMVR